MATRGKTGLESIPEKLPLDFVKKITNCFSDKLQLGTGAFGFTYKGTLGDQGKVVAVKRLEENLPLPRGTVFGEHENIINPVAYCREAQNKLVQSSNRYIIAEVTETVLCYEYLPKGSLDNHIFGESITMDWDTRFNIIKGICSGIEFLHSLQPKPLLHLNLKPQNILLDDNMVPKIADFGFSRIFGHDHSRKTTRSHVGTVGYMAPEFLYRGEISTRSDIYSLGLIILEIATRERNSSGSDQKCARNYIDKVANEWTLDKIQEKYPELADVDDGASEVYKFIEIGLKCVAVNQESRPTIKQIVEMFR